MILSNIELYYSTSIINNEIFISGEELHHIRNVMRHRIGDKIFVTDGKGKIYKCAINYVTKKEIKCIIEEQYIFNNNLSNIIFCIPRLKHTERFELAIEKSIELGISQFIFFESERTIARGINEERINKLLISSMKQSLNAWLPVWVFINNIDELNKFEGKKIFLTQDSEIILSDYLIKNRDEIISNKTYFIFGPEGGLTEKEIDSITNSISLRITKTRLRSETAIISTASLITALIQ